MNIPMHQEESPVARELRPYVHRRMHTFSDGAIDFGVRCPASGYMYLTCVYGDEMTIEYDGESPFLAPRLFIGGQLRHKMPLTRITGHVGLMGLEFTPSGFYRLFHQDCSRLADRPTPFSEFLPEQGKALEQLLLGEPEDEKRLALLQDFLLQWVPGALETPVVDEAVALIEQKYGCITVEEVATHCGMGTRQLHRYFLKVVGVGPKHFAKMVQVKWALFEAQQDEYPELTTLAQRAGYFDQAHFVHDVQRLIGDNPMGFLQSGDIFLKQYLRWQSP